MKMRAKLIRCIRYSFFLLPVVLAACYPEYEKPIGIKSDIHVNAQLVGRWAVTVDGAKHEAILYPRDNGFYDILLVSNIGEANGIDVQIFEGYSVAISSGNYLCIAKQQPKNDEVFFLIVKYAIDNDMLVIKMLDHKKISELISAGAVEGYVKKNLEWSTNEWSIRITDSSEAVKALFEKEDAADGLITDSAEWVRFHRQH